jgi:hypothetical protein
LKNREGYQEIGETVHVKGIAYIYVVIHHRANIMQDLTFSTTIIIKPHIMEIGHNLTNNQTPKTISCIQTDKIKNNKRN